MAAAHKSAPGPDPSDSYGSAWLTALGIAVALAMLALGSLALLETRNDTWRQAQQSAGNLLLALVRDINRNLTNLDLSLLGVVEALAEPGIDQASPGIRHHALFDRSATAEDLGSILVLDVNGKVVEDSTSLTPHQLSLGDRDYFQIHKRRPDAGLFVSRPYRSRLADGDLRLGISRRLSGPDGRFEGVVVGALRLNFFRRLFERLDLGSQGTITLLRSDGRILAKYPSTEADIDRDVSRGDNFGKFLRARAGQFVAKSSTSGIERLKVFDRVGDLPLILTVSLGVDEIYAPWRRKARVIGPVLVVLCGAAVASSLLFRREVLRRALVQRALADAAERLAAIAATDGLTGLANRRDFETQLDRAFRRAIRSGAPLAVLMLDADLFKPYNDTYGHPAGDDVLRAIASCMTRYLQRPDDISARYGGEEFVAVLPDTGLASALTVANRIRAAVADLAIQHAANPFGLVTVSLGVAAASPSLGDLPEDLVGAADRALYAAKRSGRNCVQAREPNRSASDGQHHVPTREIEHAGQAFGPSRRHEPTLG